MRTFQSVFNLAVDGVVGKATWYKMVYLYVGLNRLSELVSLGQQFQGVSFQYPGLLRQGDRGSDVSILQYMLALTAEFDPALMDVQVDGVFGARTAQAVRAFQRQRGLQVDGVVGERTWYALYGDFAGIERDLRNDSVSFPQGGGAVPALAGEGRSQTYGAASRLGQYPGYDLSLGRRDERGGVLV